MQELLTGLRAIGEDTRLRLLFVLAHGEFNVTELTQILGQSQPRVSRHLKLMSEAGLLQRHREGSWVLFRLAERGPVGALARMIAELLDAENASLARDLERIEAVQRSRAEAARAYFSANAADWDRIRSMHVAEAEVEAAIRRTLGEGTIGLLLDLGTGTGRVLELLAPVAEQAIGIDSSRDMLAVARANLERGRLRHCQIRHGDIYALPYANAAADVVTLHQVLHFLDEPVKALAEAARVLKPQGRMLVVDFAPHDFEFLREGHAHRRLGIAETQLAQWAARAGLEVARHDLLPPPASLGGAGLTVSLWLLRRCESAAESADQSRLPRATVAG